MIWKRSVAAPLTVLTLLAGTAGASGQLDPTFGQGGFITTEFHHALNEILGLAVQADGRILATGGTRGVLTGLALVRYTAEGDLDPTFGDGGVVVTEATEKGHAVALQADGRIVVAAEGKLPFDPDFALLRYDANGNPDPSFGAGGLVTTAFSPGSNDQANAVVVQADGRIVAAGYTGVNFDPANVALARYLADGTLDSTFGTGGLVNTDFGATSAEARALALQPDGKIVVAGRVGDDFAVLRYLPGGVLDPDFGSGGVVITDFAGGFDYGRGLVLQPDGRIVVAGYAQTGGDNDFALARYLPDGGLDPTFGTGGRVTTDLGGVPADDYGHAAALQADGRLVVGGDSGHGFGLARYDTDGSLDASFGAGGVVVLSFPDSRGRAVAVDPAGGIVAGGFVDGRFGVARLLPDGSLDADFGTAGLAVHDFGFSFDGAEAVALQPDGKIVAFGTTSGGRNDFALARYGPNGQPDLTFGMEGRVITSFVPGMSTLGTALAIRPDGRIVAGGSTQTTGGDLALARYLTDGSLDPTFGAGGRVLADIGGTDSLQDLALQADGRLVVAVSLGFDTDFRVARFTVGGALDPTFGTGGVVVIPFAGQDFMRSIAVQPDGKILAAGNVSGAVALARLNGDGSLDAGFGNGGTVVANPIGGTVFTTDVALQPDGRIVVAATVAGKFALVRFNRNGSVDLGFGTGGAVVTEITPAGANAQAVIVQPDGLITMAGAAGPNFNDLGLARYLAGGELDPTFGDGGITVSDFGHFREYATDMVFQGSGRIVVAGASAFDFLLAGYTAGLLFADGFESGNTSAWSATVP